MEAAVADALAAAAVSVAPGPDIVISNDGTMTESTAAEGTMTESKSGTGAMTESVSGEVEL
jgi:hypothetical protein